MASLNGIELRNTQMMKNEDKEVFQGDIFIEGQRVGSWRQDRNQKINYLMISDRRVSPEKLQSVLTQPISFENGNEDSIAFIDFLFALCRSEQAFYRYSVQGGKKLYLIFVPRAGGYITAMPSGEIPEDEAFENLQDSLEKDFPGMQKYISVFSSPKDFNVGNQLTLEDFII